MEPFSFASSRQLGDLPVAVRIDTLEGNNSEPLQFSKLVENPHLKHIGSNTSNSFEFYVTVQLYADSKPLTVPIQTAYKPFKANRTWLEWLKLPIRYCDIPLSSQLAITVWDLGGPLKPVPFGGTTISLFEPDCTLKKGRQKCKLWRGVRADGLSDTTTSSTVEANDEMDRLEKLFKRHEMGDIPRVEWLDNLAFRQIEQIHKASTQASSADSKYYLYVDFPRFDFPIVFSDYDYPNPTPLASMPADTGGLMSVYDPEMVRDNPVESKHRRLVRSHRSGAVDKDLKPNAKIRDELNEILNYSPVQELGSEQKDLIWKFRYYLRREKRALTKFVKSVAWSETNEAKQAIELLSEWTQIEVDDALELLGPAFSHPAVRAYAVSRLRKADDDELQLYLLQLVQALKFEKIPDGVVDATRDSSLADFLISRASENEALGTYFYWYIMVECEDPAYKKLFTRIAYDFQVAMKKLPDGEARRATLKRQADWVFMLSEFSKNIRESRETRPKKIEALKNYLADPKNGLADFEPMPLPLDPTKSITGCFPEQSNVFKSSLSPLLLHLKVNNGENYPVIFKAGDDLRQDQLVIQIIILMDRLLRKENLDLKLMPYRVLATSSVTGIMQFVPSISFAAIASDYNSSVTSYLKKEHADDTADLGISPKVLDNFVKSCAGYCVITYLLGVGDRHLDNLLLTPDGHFFHADFGFILGRDPKPFPPAMKLCAEMVEGMGGINSVHFKNFKNYCFTAYTALRKSSNLILNLFALMRDSGIPDIAADPGNVVLKVKEKFHQEMSEEEAIKHFDQLITDSFNSLTGVLIDNVHALVQRWRR